MSTLPVLLLVAALGPVSPGDAAEQGSFPLDDDVRLITPWTDDWTVGARTGPEIVGGQRLERTPAEVVELAGIVMLGTAGLAWLGSLGTARNRGKGRAK